ncbi:MAG TPA: DUF6491 family protein [Gammaproteobacteria bacterium]|nr:DUF6491 family protein [Gammaproteobacteria bacterium]
MFAAIRLVAAMFVAALVVPSAGAAEAVADHASIPFADIQGIKDWQAEGNTAMLIEAYNRRWYRVTFFSPCIELPWHVAVAFVTEPNGSLDRFSSIIAGGERCYFKTFEAATSPSGEAVDDAKARW